MRRNNPSAMFITTSPDSTSAAARESTNSRLRARAPAPSRADRDGRRRRTPRARRRRPTHLSITGVGDEVTSTIRSAPRTAASADSAATIGIGHVRAHVVDEPLAALRARRPDAHLLQLPHVLQRLEVAARLHAAADDRQRRPASARAKEPRRHGRHRGGARLGDVAAVHQRDAAPRFPDRAAGSWPGATASCFLWFSPNTVTSLAPRLAGVGTYAGIRPK